MLLEALLEPLSNVFQTTAALGHHTCKDDQSGNQKIR
jgi:hypothetical protein